MLEPPKLTPFDEEQQLYSDLLLGDGAHFVFKAEPSNPTEENHYSRWWSESVLAKGEG